MPYRLVMKTFILIFALNVFATLTVKGQTQMNKSCNKMQLPLNFSFSSLLNLNNLNHTPENKFVLSAIAPSVKYDAFFCKMELKNREHFHIWIKVHAGDYDQYMHINEANIGK